MKRVTRPTCDDGPLLEEQETEGERQLHNLLLQQLHTDVDIDRCVAKGRSFAPATLYRPFGEQAAGVRSLSQFQLLQQEEKELSSLREMGLTDAEIQLWQSKDALGLPEKTHGVCAAPDAKQQRLQTIRDKIEARDELLSRPQRFAASRPLSRREMEIEQALFQGNDRPGFLSALFHRDESAHEDQQGAPSSDPMDSLYRDVLSSSSATPAVNSGRSSPTPEVEQNNCPASPRKLSEEQTNIPPTDQPELTPSHRKHPRRPAAPVQLKGNQQIGDLCGPAVAAAAGQPLTVRGKIQTITDEEILKNRESDEGIRSIPRFRNYQPGKPSKVLCVKNLSTQASVAQLVALFSRFEREGRAPVIYRLLTGRLKGQAFVTLPDIETAQNALQLVHGHRLLGKPLVVEFGRERQEELKHKSDENTRQTQEPAEESVGVKDTCDQESEGKAPKGKI